MRFFREFFLSVWWPQFGLKLLHLVFADPKFFQCLLVRFLPIMFANAGEHGKGRNGDWKFALVRGASWRVLNCPDGAWWGSAVPHRLTMNDWPTLIEPTQSNLSYRFCLKPMTLRGGANVKTDMGPFFFRRVDFCRPYLSLVCVYPIVMASSSRESKNQAWTRLARPKSLQVETWE